MSKSAIIASLAIAAAVLPAGARAQSATAAMQAFYPSWSPETKTLEPGSRRTGFVMGAEKLSSNLHAVLIQLDPDPKSRAKVPVCEVGLLSRSEDGELAAVGKVQAQRCMGVDRTPVESIDSKRVFAVRHTNDGQRHTLALYMQTEPSTVAEILREEIQSAEQECELASSGSRTLMLTCVGRKAPDFSARLFEWNGTRFAETTARYSAGPGKPPVQGIIPGRSAGRVAIGMKMEAVRKALGKPSSSFEMRPNVSADVWSREDPKSGLSQTVVKVVYVAEGVEQIEVGSPAYRLGSVDSSKLALPGLEALAASGQVSKEEYRGEHDLLVAIFDDARRGVAYRCEGVATAMEVGKDGTPTGNLIDASDKLKCESLVVHRPMMAIIPGATEFKP